MKVIRSRLIKRCKKIEKDGLARLGLLTYTLCFCGEVISEDWLFLFVKVIQRKPTAFLGLA